MKSGSFFKIVASIVGCVWLVVAASQAGMAAEKNVFLVPVPQEPSWQEFAYLAAIPAGQTVNDSNKAAVIALDAFGTIPEEVEDYLARYSPGNTYLIDCAVDPGDPNEGLVAYWSFDEGTGSVTYDAVGNHVGQFIGNPTWISPGKVGAGALDVDVSNSVNCGTGVTTAPDMTVAFWMNTPSQGHKRPMAVSAGGYSTEPGWMVMLRMGAPPGGVWFRIHGTEGGWADGDLQINETVYEANTWVNMAFTYDGTTRKIKGYINGELRGTNIADEDRSVVNTVDDFRLGNTGTGEVYNGLLDDVRIYDRVLNDIEILMLNGSYDPSYPEEITIIPAESADSVACYLAENFWTMAGEVVLCGGEDYENALAASALAARLKVPLLYFDESAGLSGAALDVIENDLQCSTALTVSGNSTVTSQLSDIGVSQTSLADDKEIITWMGNNGYPVDYLATTNVKDRTIGNAPKSSLAAALLAAGRNGAVAPLSYDADFNHPFMHSSETTSRPTGAAISADGNYLLGTMTLNGGTYNYVITLSNTGRDFADQVNIDFNHNGNYGDTGELIQRADIVDINGKRYSVGISTYNGFWYGDLRFTYPCYEQINEDLAQFYDKIGHHPKYLAIVGFTDVFPFGITCSMMYNDVDYHITDQVFANVDSDPFYEIATGRIVGEDVTFITLFAARCLTYSDLVDLSWAQNMCQICPIGAEFRSRFYATPNQFENCGFNVDNWYSVSPQDSTKYGVFVQDEHGWPFGIEPPTFGLIAPCVVETGGCNIGAVDENYYGSSWRDWKTFNAVVLARQGAICLNASVRGTPATKDFGRDNFYKAILYDGATLGEARLHELNSMIINQSHYYHINGNVFYGDPAVKIYTPPVNPIYDAAHVTANGNTLTVHAPDIYWVDFAEIWFDPDGRYIYAAPGLSGSIYDYSNNDPAQTFIATYTTDLQITSMTQESGVPSPLGWKNALYMIDEHYDNTRTIYWQVRFDDFNYENGVFNQTIKQIHYQLTGITPRRY